MPGNFTGMIILKLKVKSIESVSYVAPVTDVKSVDQLTVSNKSFYFLSYFSSLCFSPQDFHPRLAASFAEPLLEVTRSHRRHETSSNGRISALICLM